MMHFNLFALNCYFYGNLFFFLPIKMRVTTNKSNMNKNLKFSNNLYNWLWEHENAYKKKGRTPLLRMSMETPRNILTTGQWDTRLWILTRQFNVNWTLWTLDGRQKKRCMFTSKQWDTKHYLDVNPMLFERYGRQMDVVCLLDCL